MPTIAPTKTPTKAPEREPERDPNPDRRLEPERICPNQKLRITRRIERDLP